MYFERLDNFIQDLRQEEFPDFVKREIGFFRLLGSFFHWLLKHLELSQNMCNKRIIRRVPMKPLIKMTLLRKIVIALLLGLPFMNLWTFSSQVVYASDLEQLLGRDLVKRSLNKKITVTPRGSWTEHRPSGTGIDRHIFSSCPTQPKRWKNESWSAYQKRLRNSLPFWSKACR
jgi:hypothetical protein